MQANTDFILEPDSKSIIEGLLPQSLRLQFFRVLRDSVASEHGARMTAMHQASDNAKALKEQLTLTYNNARQTAITNQNTRNSERRRGAFQIMPKILCLETATVNCSVALFDGENLIAVAESNDGSFSHSEKLHVYIKDVLDRAGISPSGLDCVAVSRGPGSYTGLRIGVSAAKGLAYALDVPVVAVDTLEIMARVAADSCNSDIYVPMIDARRMEVYTAAYSAGMEMINRTAAVIVDGDSFSYLPQDRTVCFCGDGVEKCRTFIDIPHAVFMPDVYPSARAMGGVAFRRYEAKRFEDTAYFEPYYLKDFVSTSQINKKTK